MLYYFEVTIDVQSGSMGKGTIDFDVDLIMTSSQDVRLYHKQSSTLVCIFKTSGIAGLKPGQWHMLIVILTHCHSAILFSLSCATATVLCTNFTSKSSSVLVLNQIPVMMMYTHNNKSTHIDQ